MDDDDVMLQIDGTTVARIPKETAAYLVHALEGRVTTLNGIPEFKVRAGNFNLQRSSEFLDHRSPRVMEMVLRFVVVM